MDFYRGWIEYREGFGYVGSNYWLGNKYIFLITNQHRYELRVDMEDFEGETRYAKYDHFRIGDEETKYRLSLGLYSGTAGKIVSYNHSSINVFISFVKGFFVLTLDHLPVHVR